MAECRRCGELVDGGEWHRECFMVVMAVALSTPTRTEIVGP